jgi:4-diphosphocytidyl-2-C-methyl-D-erythritol kinase
VPGPEEAPAGAVSRCAWAKVNLYLHITGRRPDGYHELDSLVVFAGIGDRLTFTPAPALSLELLGAFAADVPEGADNLVLRAAQALARRLELAPGATIRLEKSLPVAAGLGGGSADAAVSLQALSALWDRRLAPGEDMAVAAQLGADVPVCLYGRPAFMGGAGERLLRAPPLPAAWLVLVNPAVPLDTAEVFRAHDGRFSQPARWTEVAPDAPALAEILTARRNDLEPPARALVPEIDRVLDSLEAEPGCLLARLSGSGATCFGLFAARGDAVRVAGRTRERSPAWWVVAAPILHGRMDRL